MRKAVGLDFGTTNSTLAVAVPGKPVNVVRYEMDGEFTETFRSVLYFFHPHDPDARHRRAVAGPAAIGTYLTANPKGRLLQSLKSFLASAAFTRTSLYRSTYTLEDLIAIIVRQLKTAAEAEFGEIGDAVVVAGRPVRFSEAKNATDDARALGRLRRAIEAAGFTRIQFEFEPVAAAYSYEQQLTGEELVLIADFGGGTSDFSLLRLGPGVAESDSSERRILGTAGIAIGGNDFDSALVRHLVSPRLGLRSQYRSHGKLLPTPLNIFKEFERWHYLSFLKNQKTIGMLESIRANALQPEQIDNLLYVIENDLGFQLYRSVERTKMDLSAQEKTEFAFRELPADIVCEVSRDEFESWIAAYIVELADCVDRLLSDCGISTGMVDSVFLTGGSSFVPSVRKIFADKFGPSRLRSGKELTSIGEGLSLRALALQQQS